MRRRSPVNEHERRDEVSSPEGRQRVVRPTSLHDHFSGTKCLHKWLLRCWEEGQVVVYLFCARSTNILDVTFSHCNFVLSFLCYDDSAENSSELFCDLALLFHGGITGIISHMCLLEIETPCLRLSFDPWPQSTFPSFLRDPYRHDPPFLQCFTLIIFISGVHILRCIL